MNNKLKIAVIGTGYVGLSNAVLLAQNNNVFALDIDENKVNMINNKKSPIVDKEIEEYLSNKEIIAEPYGDYERALKELKNGNME